MLDVAICLIALIQTLHLDTFLMLSFTGYCSIFPYFSDAILIWLHFSICPWYSCTFSCWHDANLLGSTFGCTSLELILLHMICKHDPLFLARLVLVGNINDWRCIFSSDKKVLNLLWAWSAWRHPRIYVCGDPSLWFIVICVGHLQCFLC